MIDTIADTVDLEGLETILRDDLAEGENMAGTIVPILRHLLANEDNSVFSDEIVARVRGMVSDVAVQLLDALAQADGESERRQHEPGEIAALSEAMIGNSAFLRHIHALALEWQLTERLQARLALDAVLPPLLQALIASSDAATATLAMQLLAAQARFGQSQRRMKLPLGELPGDLLHGALVAMRTLAGVEAEADRRAARAEAAIRAACDDSRSRLGMIARVVAGMGGGAGAALSVSHAGVAIFLTALAVGAGQDRDLAVLSTNESQLARLALALRASGLKPAVVAEQFVALHPDIELPAGFDRLGADHAAAILAMAGGFPES